MFFFCLILWAQIIFESPNTELNKLLHRIFSQKTSHLDSQKIMENWSYWQSQIQSYLSHKGYYTARIKSTRFAGNTISVIIENPVQFEIEWNGLNLLQRWELNKNLKLDQWNSLNQRIDLELLSKAQRYWRNRGYHFCQISVKTVEKGPYLRKVFFDVKLGNQVKIVDVVFKGKFQITESQLKKWFFELAPTPINEKIFVESLVTDAIENLKNQLKAQGYLTAQLDLIDLHWNSQRDVELTLLIYDNDSFKVSSIEFSGNKVLSTSDLQSIILLQTGDPFEWKKFETSLDRIQKKYQELGYLEMQFATSPQQMVEILALDKSVKISISVNEGLPIVIGKISIVGVQTIDESYLINHLPVKVGEILSATAREKILTQLYNLNLFSQIQISWEPLDSKNFHVIIEVKEKDPGFLNVGFGAHNERGLVLRGYSNIGYQNLWQKAHRFSLRFDVQYLTIMSFIERSFQFSYLFPYLLGDLSNGRFLISRSTFIADFDNQVVVDALRFQFLLDVWNLQNFTISWIPWDYAYFEDYSLKTSQLLNLIKIGMTSLNLQWDRRYPRDNPRSGFLWQIQNDWARPEFASSAGVHFTKHISYLTTYWPWHNFTAVIHWRTGWLIPINGGFIPYEKVGFFLGGQNSLRGWNLNEVFPSRRDLNAFYYPLKNRAFLELWRWELRWNWKNQPWQISTFTDMGRIFFEDRRLYDSRWRQSVGSGIRYQTPIGSLALEVAFKSPPRADRQENPWVIHLAIGSW